MSARHELLRTILVGCVGVLAVARAAQAARLDCNADCDGDGAVSAAEVALSVDMLLERAPTTACPRMDDDASGRVTVRETAQGIVSRNRGACLALTGLVPAEGPPGRRVILQGWGWDGGGGDMSLRFGDVPAPVIVAVDGTASVIVPPLPGQDLDVRLAGGGLLSAALPFRILEPGPLPMTQAQFTDAADDGLRGLSSATRAVALQVSDLDDVGWTPEQSQAVLDRLDAANLALDAAREQLLLASPADAARMQSLFVESGLLAALQDISASSLAKSASVATIQEALFLGDVTSFFITNVQPVLDVAEIVAAAAAVGSGGTATPIMLFSFSVKTALKIVDGVLDILVPTDLQRIELRDRTFRPGQSVAVAGTGFFSCQSDFVGGSIETAVGIILDGAFEALPAAPPASVKQAVATKVSEILVSHGVDMLTDGVTDAFGAHSGPLFADVPVPYDPRSFRGGLASMLARAMPAGEFSGFLGQLDEWGVPLLDVDVVAVENESVATYDAIAARLVGGAAAGSTRYRAWGLRFEDRPLFWGLLTLSVPHGVLSEWAAIVLDPNATTEPPNIEGISPVTGFEGDHVTFAATVTGAQPMTHEWSFGHAATPSTSTEAAPQVTLGPVRTYTVTLRATNEYGTDERGFVLTILRRGGVPGWVLVPVTTQASTILQGGVKILVVGGRPTIFYVTQSGGSLQCVRALDEQGRAWGAPVTVVPAVEVYDAAFSVGIVGGRPAIAHSARTGGSVVVKFRRALDDDGASWDSGVQVAGPWTFGSEVSLMMAGGRPAILYRHPDTRRMTFQRSVDETGSAWGSPAVIADEAANVNVRGGLVAGRPAAAWVNVRKLRYAIADDAAGTSWGPALTVRDVGSSTTAALLLEGSLVDSGGVPSISFVTRSGASAPYEIEHARATNAAGDAWALSGAIDPGAIARFAQSARCGGRIAIVYEATNTGLERRLLWADFPSSDSWPAPIIVDTTGQGEPGIAEVLGRPAIAFVQDTTRVLLWGFFDPESE